MRAGPPPTPGRKRGPRATLRDRGEPGARAAGTARANMRRPAAAAAVREREWGPERALEPEPQRERGPERGSAPRC